MKTNIRSNLNNLQMSDVSSLLLFALYKVKDIPGFAVLSELCYLLDGSNLLRLFTYFAGKTVTFPTEEEFVIMCSAMLMYQYINIDNMSFVDAQNKLEKLTPKQKEEVTEMYVKLIPIMDSYNIDRSQVNKYDR